MIRVLVAVVALAAAPAPLPAPEGLLVFLSFSLEDAQRLALADSPDVIAAGAVVAQNAAALAAARSAVAPSAYVNYNLAPQGVGNGTESQRLTSYGLQTTLNDVLTYSPQVAAAEANLRAAVAQRAAALSRERIKGAGLYFDALKARATLRARQSAVQLANEQLHSATVRFGAGDAPRLDVVRARVAVARSEADAALASAADANAAEALTIETGASDRALAETAPAAASGRSIVAPGDAVRRALASRPEIVAADAATRAAQAAARAAVAGRFPAISVQGGYATGVDSGVVVGGPQVAINATLPLDGGGRARAELQRAVATENAARADAVRRDVRLGAAAAARNLAAAGQAVTAAANAREAAAAVLEATRLGYGRGYSSGFELAGARDAYTQALVDELSARYDEAKARAILSIDIGDS